jgi:multicomponent Na+:H+ antiporter subunit F
MNLHDYIYFIILPVLMLSVALVFFRFLRGPSMGDRVISLDLLITIGIAIIAAYSIISDQPAFLDIALILALISFLGTIAYSYYLEKKTRKND